MTASQTHDRRPNNSTDLRTTLLEEPYRPYRAGTPVNPAGHWRMTCPEGHSGIYWWGPTTIACQPCDETVSPESITDEKRGLSLAELVEASGGRR